jgi:hypothetical protein
MPPRKLVMLWPLLLALGGDARAEEREEPAEPESGAASEEGSGADSEAIDEQQPRRPDATWREIFSGPFQSSRLFAMPIADVVGAYQLTLSGDGSLLRETGILSSAGVLAIGFGDIAQLEYRHTGVIGIERSTAPIPAAGVQLKAPFRERKYVPAFAIAFRLGVPRSEHFDSIEVEETVTDLYLVGRLRLWGPLRVATLHGGVRVSSAEMKLLGPGLEEQRTMYLPAGGWEIQMNSRTRLVGEAALVPTFELESNSGATGDVTPHIDYGVLGRMGIRWLVHPTFAFDASIGYHLEVAKLTGATDRGITSVVDWDIRLGGEAFVPWGAMVCRAAGVFCE